MASNKRAFQEDHALSAALDKYGCRSKSLFCARWLSSKKPYAWPTPPATPKQRFIVHVRKTSGWPTVELRLAAKALGLFHFVVGLSTSAFQKASLKCSDYAQPKVSCYTLSFTA